MNKQEYTEALATLYSLLLSGNIEQADFDTQREILWQAYK